MDLALFDFDGTITKKETMPDFFQLAVRPGRLLLGKILLLPLILGYKAKLVSGVRIRAVLCFCGFWRVPAEELSAHGVRFAKDFLPSTLRAEAMERIAWHKARGDTVVVVSAGLDLYLAHWCQEHGVALLCSALEQRNGILSGRYLGRQCVADEKARLVKERFPLQQFSRVFAYGDTTEDRELLALADEPYYRWLPGTCNLSGERQHFIQAALASWRSFIPRLWRKLDQRSTSTLAIFSGVAAVMVGLVTFALSWNLWELWGGPMPGSQLLLWPGNLTLVYIWHPLFTAEVNFWPKLGLLMLGQFFVVATVAATVVEVFSRVLKRLINALSKD